MINVNFGPNFILGCFVILIGIILYGIRFINPKIAEEKDIFLSTLFLLYSLIIIIHGWRLDPILFFSQILIVFLSILFFGESLSLRLRLLKQKKNIAIKKKILEERDNEIDFDEEPVDIFQIFK